MVIWESLWFYLEIWIFIGINQLRVVFGASMFSMIALKRANIPAEVFTLINDQKVDTLKDLWRSAVLSRVSAKSHVRQLLFWRTWKRLSFVLGLNVRFDSSLIWNSLTAFVCKVAFCHIFNCVGKKRVSLRAPWKWWCCLASVAASRRDGAHTHPSLCHQSGFNHSPKNCFSYAVASWRVLC